MFVFHCSTREEKCHISKQPCIIYFVYYMNDTNYIVLSNFQKNLRIFGKFIEYCPKVLRTFPNINQISSKMPEDFRRRFEDVLPCSSFEIKIPMHSIYHGKCNLPWRVQPHLFIVNLYCCFLCSWNQFQCKCVCRGPVEFCNVRQVYLYTVCA